MCKPSRWLYTVLQPNALPRSLLYGRIAAHRTLPRSAGNAVMLPLTLPHMTSAGNDAMLTLTLPHMTSAGNAAMLPLGQREHDARDASPRTTEGATGL